MRSHSFLIVTDEYDIIESSKEEVTPSSNLPNPSDRLTPDPAPPSNIAPNSETIENPTPVFSKIATQPSPPDPPSTSPLTNRCDSSLIDRDHVTESDQSSVTYPTNSQTSTNVSSQQGLNSSPQPHIECKAAPQPTAPEPLRSVPSSKGNEMESNDVGLQTGRFDDVALAALIALLMVTAESMLSKFSQLR